MTIGEAAQELGVSRAQVRSLIKEGRLQAEQNPLDKRERLVPAETVRQFLSGRDESTSLALLSIASIDDGRVLVPSDEIEEYLRASWHP